MRSPDAADTIGISYRRLDYLTRCGVFPGGRDGAGRHMNRGSGSRRTWDPEVVVRLALAYRMSTVLATTSASSRFPELARLAVEAPTPPRRGYALVAADPLTLLWAASWADVRTTLEQVGAALVVTYDLDELVGDRIDLDATLGHTE